MKYIFFIFCSIILPVISLNEMKPKLCIDCKYIIKNSRNDKYSKCFLFTKKENYINYLVNGIDEMRLEYHFCSVARNSESMCGEKGKMYEKNNFIK